LIKIFNIVKKLLILLPCIFLGFIASAKYAITKATPIEICTSVYPTTYSTINFSIRELSPVNTTQGFSQGQTNQQLILGFSNSSFSFNPGVGTVTASGTEVTIVSFSITSTQIIINITTAASNTQLNTISFNNIQVRSDVAGTTIIRRVNPNTGFRVDGSNKKPGDTESFADLVAGTPFSISSAPATQLLPGVNVYSGTNQHQILRIEMTVSGTCGAMTVTAVTLNTVGSTNALNDISRAQLFYTGKTNLFSTANQFGFFANPNGTYTITGNQSLNLGAGTYYFWLTYDISATAINANVVDAQIESMVINGINSTNLANPAGNRPISNRVYHSRFSGNWNNNAGLWEVAPGAGPCGCRPDQGNGYVFVYHDIEINASNTVDFVFVNGGLLRDNGSNFVTVTQDLRTIGSGIFRTTTTWNLNNLFTTGTGTSTTNNALTINGQLSVGAGTIFQQVNAGSLNMTINGSITVDGTFALATSNLTSSNALGLYLLGTGTITGSGTMTFGVNKSAMDGTNLTVFPILSLTSGTIFNNYARINMRNNIIGGNVNSRWINHPNSVLEMGGTTSAVLTTGTLEANASGNIVRFNGSGNQTIKIPESDIFHHLQIAGSGIKDLNSITTINGNLDVSSDAQFATDNFNITANGNWINNGTNATPFLAGTDTVTFNGLSNTIIGTGITHFRNLSISETGSLTSNSNLNTVWVSGNWVNEGNFIHNFSDITFNGTTTISGASFTEYFTAIVNSGNTLTLHNLETYIDGNLTVNGTLNHNNGLLRFLGDGNTQNINGLTSVLTLHRMEVAKVPAGAVVLSRPLTVNNQLILTQGTITSTNTNVLTLIAGATSNEGSAFAYVDGPMAKEGNTAFVFPIGKNGKWARLAIGAPSASTTFRAEYFNTPYGNVTSMAATPLPKLYNVSKLEHWMLDRISGAGNTTVRLYWEDAEWSVIDNCTTTDLRIGRWNGTAWVNVDNTITTTGTCSGATAGTITTTSAVSNFSPFTFASLSSEFNALPIKLLTFDAKPEGSKVALKWATATEFNNDFFTIEKTKDGRNFEKVASIKGAGNSITTQNYTADDLAPYSGIFYYRLGQTDYDGNFTYSDLVAVKIEAPSTSGFDIYPNPLLEDQNLTLNIFGSKNEKFEVRVVDQMGQVFYSATMILENDVERYSFNAALPPGLYIVTGTVNHVIVNKKLVVK
jgi:hypothetical protein